MHPISHLFLGWTLANLAGLDRRDRMLVTVAGVIPDLDGLGVVVDIATEGTRHPTWYYDQYHHLLGHNLAFGLALLVLAIPLARRRVGTPLLVLLSFHLHLLADILGSRGPDGYQWPIPYLLPFSKAWTLTWSGQWELKAWPNVVASLVMMALALWWSWKRGRSPLELVSRRADARLTETLRARFGVPG